MPTDDLHDVAAHPLATAPRPRPPTAGASTGAAMHRLLAPLRKAHAARIWPEIADPTPEQRAAMPYRVDCPGLTVHDLGQAFADELQRRKKWCREHCRGFFAVEPMRDGRFGLDTGRLFRFSDPADASMFRLSWC